MSYIKNIYLKILTYYYKPKLEVIISSNENKRPRKKRENRSKVPKTNFISKDIDAMREALNGALGTGEIITIKYWSGSSPGSERDIVPLGFNDNGNLEARCLKRKRKITFYIDKIEFTDLLKEDEAS